MKELSRSSALIGSAQVVQMGAGLVRGKLLALLLGPAGVGIVAQVATYQTTLVSLAQFGVPAGTSKLIAQADRDSHISRGDLLVTAYLTVAVLSLLITAAALLLGPWLEPIVLGDESLSALASIAIVGVLFAAVVGLNEGVFQGTHDAFGFSSSRALAAVASVALLVPAAIVFGIYGAVAALTVQVMVAALFGIWLLRRRLGDSVLVLRGAFKWQLNRRLVRIGAAVTVTLFSSAASLLAVRAIVLTYGTAADNGFMQAVWAITSQLSAVVVSVLSSYTLPRGSQAADRASMDVVLNNSCTYALLLLVPPLIIFASVPGLIVSALYSEAFLPAVALVAPKALGDLLYVTLWPLGTPLLVAERLRAYTVLNLVGSVLLVIGSAVLFPSMGLAGIGWAYVFAMATWLVCYLLDQRAYGFRLSRTTTILLLSGSASIAVLGLAPIDPVWRAVLGGLLLAVWCICTWRVGLGSVVRGLIANRSLRAGAPV